MNVRLSACLALSLSLAALAACRTPPSVGTTVQEDAHTPLAWRPLSPTEKATFDLGYAVFNTEWAPAGLPAGRTDGLGPLFNQQSCDSCHNSRRRGRGPRDEGDAPGDLVIQLGRVQANGHIERGTHAYGLVLNTSAVRGFIPEAAVSIQFEEQIRTLKDGTQVHLRVPTYRLASLSGPPLAPDTVLMPRMAPSIYGVGLIERVPATAIAKLASSKGRSVPLGRFGWQATEPTVASQTASALGREMGLTSALLTHSDCGDTNDACWSAPSGGSPEVEPQLFEPLLLFQELHSVPVAQASRDDAPGLRLFKKAGCASCHVLSLPVKLAASGRAVIHPYTDLLVHFLGEPLADRDLNGKPARSEWRTAPLWGLGAAAASGQPLRLLHDGRARSIEEAILWHDGEAHAAREHYASFSAIERATLQQWLSNQ